MEEKLLCVCGASLWTRAVGWLQVTGSILLIASLSWSIYGSSIERVQLNHTVLQVNDHVQTQRILELKFQYYYLVGSAIGLVLATCSLVLGVVLLRGAYEKNSHCLRAWMINAIACLFIWSVESVFLCTVAPSCEAIAVTLLKLVFLLAIQGFSLWAVDIHKKEIEVYMSGFVKA